MFKNLSKTKLIFLALILVGNGVLLWLVISEWWKALIGLAIIVGDFLFFWFVIKPVVDPPAPTGQ